jgi:hypothetical protein
MGTVTPATSSNVPLLLLTGVSEAGGSGLGSGCDVVALDAPGSAGLHTATMCSSTLQSNGPQSAAPMQAMESSQSSVSQPLSVQLSAPQPSAATCSSTLQSNGPQSAAPMQAMEFSQPSVSMSSTSQLLDESTFYELWCSHRARDLGSSSESSLSSSFSQVMTFSSLTSATISIRRTRDSGGRVDAFNLVHNAFELHIDMDSSMISNPFTSAPSLALCKAFDDLLKVSLFDFDVRRDGDSYDAFEQAYSLGAEEQRSDLHRQLLQSLADRHGTLVHWHPRLLTPSLLRAWLARNASLLLQGTNLCLVCQRGEGDGPPGTSHAQCLAGALVWVVCAHSEQLSSLCSTLRVLSPQTRLSS